MSIYKKDKLTSLYKTKEWSDCVFRIEDEDIAAHKFLLACSSPVFESMFYGHMASNLVHIEDIEADTFKKMLEYIYTDNILVDNILDAWSLIYASQKYFLYELQAICVKYVKDNMSIQNLLLSYEHARLYNQKTLAEKCLGDIVTYTRGLILFNEYHMQVDTLRAIIKENRGDLSDMVMLGINWGLEECTLNDLNATKDNLYGIFRKNNLLSELPFSKFKFFCNKFTLKTLNKDQMYHFENVIEFSQQFYLDHIDYCSPVPCKTSEMSFDYRAEYKNSLNLRIMHNEIISPTVYTNRDCLLFGVVVTTKCRPPQSVTNEYVGGANIYIYNKRSNQFSHLIFQHECHRSFLQYNDSQKIIFPMPVLLQAYKEYLICVAYEGDGHNRDSVLLRYMSDKLLKNKNDTTVIHFSNEGNGSVLRGLCFYKA